MPRCAISNLPGLRATAPVNAPFSWPKSSVSSSVSGIAAQLIATNGASARGLSAWSDRANSSLPVPLSPSSSTVVSVAAARCSEANTLRSEGSSPTSCGAPRRTASSSFISRFSVTRRRCSSARPTSSSRWSGSTGLARKSSAPSFIAVTASSMLPYAVMTMTGTSASISFEARRTPNPSPSGRRRSDRTSAGCVCCRSLHGFRLIARLDDGVPLPLERMPQHRSQRVFVFDEENLGRGRHARARVRRQRIQPGGTLALRASSSISTIAFFPFSISVLTRSSSSSAF